MLRIPLTAMLTIIAILSIQLGFSWLDVGHGLHPALAFPVATVAILWIAYITRISYQSRIVRDSLDEIRIH